jgi:hypothetical protein
MAVTTPCACLRASDQVRRRLGAGELWVWHFPREPVDKEMETAGRPKFLGNPDVLMPCSLTPAGPTRQAIQRSRRGPRSHHDEGSHDSVISGLNGTASALAVYASPAGLPAEDARLASGCWPLYQAGLPTRRVPTKGFCDVSYIAFSFPKLLGAGRVSPAVARRASHRSVRAQLRHTARQVRDWPPDGTPSEPPPPLEAGTASAKG